MKNIFPTISSLLAIAVFVFLNWATSQETTVINLIADVNIYQDSIIILDNQDDLAIENAELNLILESDNTITEYSLIDYSLASFSQDTIFMDEFSLPTNSSATFPVNSSPDRFTLFFLLPENNTEVYFEKNFQ